MTEYLLCVIVILLANFLVIWADFSTMTDTDRERESALYGSYRVYWSTLLIALFQGALLYGALRASLWGASEIYSLLAQFWAIQ